MTNQEKLARLNNLILPEEASEALLLTLLDAAAEIVLTRRYPFGYPFGAEVPPQYAMTQVRIALELYSKLGAEGQTAHNENGISRSWEAADVSPSLLKRIVPLAGGVRSADA